MARQLAKDVTDIKAENGALYNVRYITDFRDLIQQSVLLYGNESAYMLKDKETGKYNYVSYQELQNDIQTLGTALWSMGYAGKKVAVMGNNSYKWAISFLAVTCGLGVVVPIDKELPFDDINNILTISEAAAIICDKKAYKKLKDRRKELPEDMDIIVMEAEKDKKGYLAFDGVMAKGKTLMESNDAAFYEYRTAPIDPDALAVLNFTSGTSGLAKGVMLSQRNICFVIMSNSSVAFTGPGDRMLSMLPIHHAFECSLGFLLPLYTGCCIGFMESLLRLTRNFQEIQPTIIFTVPMVVEKFYNTIEKTIMAKNHGDLILKFGLGAAKFAHRFGSRVETRIQQKLFEEIHKTFGGHLRLFIVGAAAIDPVVVENFKRFGIGTYVGYGMTECAPLISCNHDALFTTDTVGNAIPGVEIKIDKPNRHGVGEVMVKGPNVMLGYYKNEELTKETITEDGWLHTGDLGKFNEEGRLQLTGRVKNMILSANGENVYPEEIEYLLNKNPYIAESMVVGNADNEVEAKIYPDTEAIAEKLQKDKDQLTPEMIKSFLEDVVKEVNRKLPKYKNILSVDVRENEFIKTTTAKIKRYANMDDPKKTEADPAAPEASTEETAPVETSAEETAEATEEKAAE